MPTYDYFCEDCDIYFCDIVPMSKCTEPSPCPDCEKDSRRAYVRAPLTRTGGEGSDRQISSMKRSFRQRFVKKEIDDIRHKHGNLFDESLVSKAVDRIKKNEVDEVD